eukprot:1358343-Prymnesium_polylepis.1
MQLAPATRTCIWTRSRFFGHRGRLTGARIPVRTGRGRSPSRATRSATTRRAACRRRRKGRARGATWRHTLSRR